MSLRKAGSGLLTPLWSSRAVRVLVAALIVVPVAAVAGTMLGGSASASPASEIAKVQRQVEKLQREAEIASEDYNDTREQLKALDVRVNAAHVRLEQQQARVAQSRRLVGRLAAESYRSGDLGTLELYLGDDPDLLLAQSGVVETLADRQAGAITRLKEAQRKLAGDTADLGRQEAKAAAANAKLAAKKKEVEAKLAKAKAVLSRLTAAQRRALERASRDADRRDSGDTGVIDDSGPGGTLDCGSAVVNAPTARVKNVLEFACSELGDPYQWGADGPGSYDCSGYTMKAWAQGGVSLPHSSRMQATYGTRISASNMRAGDLLFYYSPISHVAIYLGNDLMAHAPSTGSNVKVVPVRMKSLTAVVRL